MKTASLLLTFSTFIVPSAFCQAAAGYGGAAGASTTTAAGAAGGLGGSVAGALSGIGTATSTTSAGGASSRTVQRTRSSLSATRTRTISAELAQKISSNDAKVGDEVVARTTSTALLSGGLRLPMGTKLIGRVTKVQPVSGDQREGHLAFAFRRAVLADGRQVPIHAALDSISAPHTGAVTTNSSSGRGAGVRRTELASSTAPTVISAPIRVTGTDGSTVYGADGTVAQSSAATFAAISNVPGLTASSSAFDSTILDTKNGNVELSSGTQMVLTIATN